MNDLTIPAYAPTNDLTIPASAPASAEAPQPAPESTTENANSEANGDSDSASDKSAVVPPELRIESSTDRLPARPFTEKLPNGTVINHH